MGRYKTLTCCILDRFAKNIKAVQTHKVIILLNRGRIDTVIVSAGGLTCVFKYITGFLEKKT